MNFSRFLVRSLRVAPLVVAGFLATAPEPARAGLLGGLLGGGGGGGVTTGRYGSQVAIESTGLLGLPLIQQTLGLLGWQTTYRYDAANLLAAKPTGLLSATVSKVLDALNALPVVKRAEDNLFFSESGEFGGEQSQAPVFANDLNQASMRCQPGFDLIRGRGSRPAPRVENVTVAIVDGGFRLDHEALSGRIAGSFDAIDNDASVNDPGNGIDDDGDGITDLGIGHGTAVASLVASLAPNVRILAVRAMDDEAVATTSTLAAAIDWAISRGANVINASLGSRYKSNIVDAALARARNAGIQVVCSSGNGGDDFVTYPASSGYAMAVTGVGYDGVHDAGANYGPQVKVSAPNVSVVAPFPGSTNGYGRWTGTSFASPMVAAAVALGVEAGMGQATVAASTILDASAPYAHVPSECTGEVGRGILSIEGFLEQ